MAFEELSSSEIVTGKPVKEDLFSKIKNSLDDHETRITAAEAATQTFSPLTYKVKGYPEGYYTVSGLFYERIFTNITLTSARVFVITAGSSGTFDFDVQYKRGGGAFASIFTTRPSVAYTDGNYAISSNAVFSVTSLLSGDILRIDLSGAQSGSDEAHLYLTYEVS